jgi:hypothetical protein
MFFASKDKKQMSFLTMSTSASMPSDIMVFLRSQVSRKSKDFLLEILHS